MLRTNLLIPIGSFVVAILLSLLSAPASRQVLLRAADAPTGGTTPTPHQSVPRTTAAVNARGAAFIARCGMI